MNKLTLIFCLGCSILVGCKSHFDLAEEYTSDKDYDSAFAQYQKAADDGDMRAWNSLGVAYCQGRGTEVNYAKGFICFVKGAEAGLPGAICNLGHCYRYGYGVERDIRKAEEYYTKAARSNMPQALYALGMYYLEQKDISLQQKGFEILLKCANLNHAPAQLQVANCFYNGTGVEQNHTEAAFWFLITSRNEGDDAKAASKLLFDVVKNMNSANIAKIKARADAFRNDNSAVK